MISRMAVATAAPAGVKALKPSEGEKREGAKRAGGNEREGGERDERDPIASFSPCARFIHCDGDVEAEFLNSGYLPPGVRDQVSLF